MADLKCDVAVIGAGTAGLSAERHARDEGASTLLIDPHFSGTTCATTGCMPSKLLLASGHAAQAVRDAGEFGIEAGPPKVDGRAVMARLRKHRDRFAEATRKSFDTLPDGVCIKAHARFSGPNRLELSDGRSVEAGAIVIATGASPVIPPPLKPAAERCLTHETLFEIETLPKSLGVIGAGPLGLELAQAMHQLGVRVAVFDKGDTMAGLQDEAVHESAFKALSAELPIHLGCDVEAALDGDGVRLNWSGQSEGEAVFEQLLVAAGRAPQLDSLDLEAAGLDLDDTGVPHFDPDTMQCGSAPVFIAGDANQARPILHEASFEGTVAGRNAATFPGLIHARRKTPLQIVFTAPNIAVVGAVPAEEEGHVIGAMSFEDQGRAKVEGRNLGACRVYGDIRDGKLIGASLCGPDIEHIAHLFTWSIECGATASELLSNPFYHPTVEEGLKGALQDICKAVKAPKPRERDDGPLPGG